MKLRFSAVWLILASTAGCDDAEPECEKACWHCDAFPEDSNLDCCDEGGHVGAASEQARISCVQSVVEDPCSVDTLAIDRCYWSTLDEEGASTPAATAYCEAMEETLGRCDIEPYWRRCPTAESSAKYCTYGSLDAEGLRPIGCEIEANVFTRGYLDALRGCASEECDDLVACLEQRAAMEAPGEGIFPVPGYGFVGADLCRDGLPTAGSASDPCRP